MSMHACPECKKPLSTEAKACPQCGYTRPRGRGLLVVFLAAVIGVCGLVVFGSLTGGTTPSPASPPTAAQQAAAEGCRAKLNEARDLGVLHDLDYKPGKTPKVVVGPTFLQLPFEAKEGFAATVNCFLLGGTGGSIGFDLVEFQNHRVVGTWSYGRFKAT